MKPICIRVPNWLGDSVMARPFVAAAQRHHMDAHLVLVAHRRVADLWRGWPGAEVIDYDAGRGRWQAIAVTARNLRGRGPFDAGYILPPSFSSALLFALAGVKSRIGFTGDSRGWLLSKPVQKPSAMDMEHRSKRYLDLLNGASSAEPPAYAWPRHAHESVEARLRRDGLEKTRFVVAGVGTEGEAKRYPIDRWREVVRELAAEIPVVLVGTERERRWSAEIMAQSGGHVFDWCGQTTLPELGALIGRAAAFMGADSGAAHLAASMDVPTVVIFGPGEPAEVRPLGRHVVILREPLWCSPCRRHTCHRRDHPKECLDLIVPSALLNAVRLAVATYAEKATF